MAERLEKRCYSIEKIMGSGTNDNPFERFKFFTLIEDENERLYIVGPRRLAFGCSVEAYNPESGKWLELNKRSDGPGLISYSTVHYNKCIYLFGGMGNMQTSNDLWRFSLETLQWSRVTLKNPKPPSRHCHASFVIDGSKMLVLGGDDGIKAPFLIDMWALDLKELETGKGQWSQIKVTGLPNGTIAPSNCCKLDSQTLVLCDLCNFIWKFDWKTKSWIKLTKALDHLNLFYLARWNEKIHFIYGNPLNKPYDMKDSRPKIYLLNLDVVATNKFKKSKLTEVFPINAKSNEVSMSMALCMGTPCVPMTTASNYSYVFAALVSNGRDCILHRIKFCTEESSYPKLPSKGGSVESKSKDQPSKKEPDLNHLSQVFFDKIVGMKLEEEKK